MSWIIFLTVVLIVIGALYVARTVGLPWDDEPRDPPPHLRYVDDRAIDPRADADDAERAEAPLLFVAAVAVATLLAIVIAVHLWSSPAHRSAAPATTAPAGTLPTAAARAPSQSAPIGSSIAPAAGATGATGASVQFQTAGRDVHMRAAASTDSAIVGLVIPFGSTVTLSCYQSGQPVYRDPDWFLASYGGTTGFMSGLWLNAAPVVATLARCS